ncbi:cell surface glycoprotein 1-like [Stegodyphus dumicola]|uniref:cell surface glycoprotein 1-like n=1 Tax=Stegodyphus dumicola TaxID=202533 RepID=UPI0015A8C869|nr:cell surface glycoprotein 1-like [Stegodyphus dumicola]
MIKQNHGVTWLLVTCTLIGLVASTQNEKRLTSNNSTTSSNTLATSKKDSSAKNGTAEFVRLHRRAPRFDTAGSSPWVRVYNRPPGSKTDSFFNYETRGNTSAHTSGEAWSGFEENVLKDNAPAAKEDLNAQVQDILRVKPKGKNSALSNTKIKTPEIQQEIPQGKTVSPPTKTPQTTVSSAPVNNDAQKKGYIAWSSNDGASPSRWASNDAADSESKDPTPAIEETITTKDGNRWKVVGKGGEGWEVVDDKGAVEWKIEYDDGEWRVTSTGNAPNDVEWADPEYVWGPSDGSLSEDDEYNSWPADDYGYTPPWIDPQTYVPDYGNYSWPKKGDDIQKPASAKDEARQDPSSGWQDPVGQQTSFKEPVPYGTRRRTLPEKTRVNSAERRTSNENAETADHSVDTEPPQADQPTPGKSWRPSGTIIGASPEWVEGYGSNAWEGDNSGWNAGYGRETWIAENKDYPSGQWVPKPGPGQIKTNINENSEGNAKTPIRAWGTGYGSKTWKGSEWNSNVVWKTGFGGPLPWSDDNSTWKFPDSDTKLNDLNKNKRPPVWSQPVPSTESTADAGRRESGSTEKKPDAVDTKRLIRPFNRGNNLRKTPPHRRTEGESWGDDSSTGGVVWKEDIQPPAGQSPTKVDGSQSNTWQPVGWRISGPSGKQKDTVTSWKSGRPNKSSNLISVLWKTGTDIPSDAVPAEWDRTQFPNSNSDGTPAWNFDGCKMTIKCGSKTPDVSDDSIDINTPPSTQGDTYPPPTESPPSNVGKSWKPPKSWRPPSWEQPSPPSGMRWKSPPPTVPTTSVPWKSPPTSPSVAWKSPPSLPPSVTWEQPTPSMSWRKPTPPSTAWRQPPSSKIWKQPTPPPTLTWTEQTPDSPSVSWNSPPPMRWKRPGRKPTKSWKPPPTKSWKPPIGPSQTWTPAIATPAPDVFPPQTKPDCKDGTPQPTAPPSIEDNDDDTGPPQIIIITKLPNGLKPPGVADDSDTKDTAKPPSGPWIFPPRKGSPKGGKTRKDKKVPVGGSVNRWPARPPKRNSKPSNKQKGWPKGMLPPNFGWTSNSLRRSTTKKPVMISGWKPSDNTKPKTWRQMLKKLINGR